MYKAKSIERLEALTSPPNGSTPLTVKDQEALIQTLKKENFDLKLRLFMESKEFDQSTREDQRTITDLENEIGEVLRELEASLQREKQLEADLDAARRREKALMNKQKRAELALSEKDEEIKYLNKELVKVAIGTQNEGFYRSEANFRRFEEELEPEEHPSIDELKCKLFIDAAQPEQENDLNQSPEDNTRGRREEYAGSFNKHRGRVDNFSSFGRGDKQRDAEVKGRDFEENSSVDENDSRSSTFISHRSFQVVGRSSSSYKHQHENNIPTSTPKDKTYQKYREVCVDDGSSVERVGDKKSVGKEDGADPAFIQLTNLTNLTDTHSESVPDVRHYEYHNHEKTSRHEKYLYNNGVIADLHKSRSIDDLQRNETKKDKKKKGRKLYKMLCCLAPKLSKDETGSLPRDYRPTPVSGQV